MVAVLAIAPAAAHHSYVEFDQQNTVEIEGTLVAAVWQNPHSRLTVAIADGTQWDIESASVNSLSRTGAPLETLFAIGTRVKVAGWPSTRAVNRLYGLNILSSDNQELMLHNAPPRWNADAFGRGRQTRAAPDASATSNASASSAPTIFRAWGSAFGRPGVPDDPDASPGALRRVPLPLTEVARQAFDSFDRVEYAMTLECGTSMPMAMTIPGPTDFVDRGETILWRLEEFDTVRTFHMNSREDPASQPKTPLGYSVGRWEGETLVVETGSVGAKYLIRPGVPLGPDASFVERFTPSADGNRLHYTILMTDPYSLTQPVEQKRSWVAISGQVMPYNCAQPGN